MMLDEEIGLDASENIWSDIMEEVERIGAGVNCETLIHLLFEYRYGQAIDSELQVC